MGAWSDLFGEAADEALTDEQRATIRKGHRRARAALKRKIASADRPLVRKGQPGPPPVAAVLVLEALRTFGWQSLDELQSATGLKRATVYRACKRLVSSGHAEIRIVEAQRSAVSRTGNPFTFTRKIAEFNWR